MVGKRLGLVTESVECQMKGGVLLYCANEGKELQVRAFFNPGKIHKA